ncbi:hypothetical protein D3C85_1508700 [compost metagenome]
MMADQINTGCGDICAAWDSESRHFRTEIHIGDDHSPRYNAVLNNVLLMVDIMYE